MELAKLKEMLIRHEGKRLKPYTDSVGKLTIGVGRNLDDVGITEDEADLMLMNDISRAMYDLNYHLPWWDDLDPVRQMVMVDMCFNLGIGSEDPPKGLLGFKNTLASIKSGNYESAAQQMLRSKWASQVGDRATELSEMMRGGER